MGGQIIQGVAIIGCKGGAQAGKESAGAAAERSLYDRLGGEPAIKAVVDQFVANVAADSRINKHFANAKRLVQTRLDHVSERALRDAGHSASFRCDLDRDVAQTAKKIVMADPMDRNHDKRQYETDYFRNQRRHCCGMSCGCRGPI